MLALLAAATLSSACLPRREALRVPPAGSRKAIVVSYAILGSVVQDLVEGAAEVRVLVPNGLDIHEWEPSARDVEALMHADLVVVNGLGLEGGLGKSLDRARGEGRPFFVAADHVTVRVVGEGEGIPGQDPDQAKGAQDPHLWTDPSAMKAVVLALAPRIAEVLGLDVAAKAGAMAKSLDALDAQIAQRVAALPAGRRVLVTGHESLGYFAKRYGFRLVGALVPSLSSEAEASASWLAELKVLIARNGVPVIFTETGTSKQLVLALAQETGVRAVPLATHLLPEKGGYVEFERTLAMTVVDSLQ